MNKLFVIFGVIAALSGGFLVYGKMTEPKSYEDCILKNVKNANNQAAVSVVAHSCRKIFPLPVMTDEEFLGKNY
ncbi:MAG TPA: hypothetical protein DCZ63_15210 [Geobacter sp.]|nr:hypothetical protein [Geobacter sp.]